jgi:hypothetical protein
LSKDAARGERERVRWQNSLPKKPVKWKKKRKWDSIRTVAAEPKAGGIASRKFRLPMRLKAAKDAVEKPFLFRRRRADSRPHFGSLHGPDFHRRRALLPSLPAVPCKIITAK